MSTKGSSDPSGVCSIRLEQLQFVFIKSFDLELIRMIRLNEEWLESLYFFFYPEIFKWEEIPER